MIAQKRPGQSNPTHPRRANPDSGPGKVAPRPALGGKRRREGYVPSIGRMSPERQGRYKEAVLKRLDELIKVRFRRSVREAVDASIRIGEALVKLKQATLHGEYLRAIAERWHWRADQAENYVKIFRNAESIRHLAETYPDSNQWELLRMVNQEHARRDRQPPLQWDGLRAAMQRGALTEAQWNLCRRIAGSGPGDRPDALAQRVVAKGWTAADLERLHTRMQTLGPQQRARVIVRLIPERRPHPSPDDPPPVLPDPPLTEESIGALVTGACYEDPASVDARDVESRVEEAASRGARYREELAYLLRCPQASPLARHLLRQGAPLRGLLDEDQRQMKELLERMQRALDLVDGSRDPLLPRPGLAAPAGN